MKVVFTMANPEPKKHSTRFDFEKFEGAVDMKDKPYDMDEIAEALPKFKPSFYVPNPLGRNAKRIRVTIEEID